MKAENKEKLSKIEKFFIILSKIKRLLIFYKFLNLKNQHE
jgi:hypothetical protein